MDEYRLARDLYHAALYAEYRHQLPLRRLAVFAAWQRTQICYVICDRGTVVVRDGPLVRTICECLHHAGYRYGYNAGEGIGGTSKVETIHASAHHRFQALARFSSLDGRRRIQGREDE